jgi:hypothetical protein
MMSPKSKPDLGIAGHLMVLLCARGQTPPRDSQFTAADEKSCAAVTAAAEFSPVEGRRNFGVADGALIPVAEPREALFAARVIRWNFGAALAIVAYCEGLLVNGLKALQFSVLDIRSTLVVPGIDAFFYVTEKIKPYVGPPPTEILGRECPACKIPFDVDTRVGACRCGQFFHFETPESHSDVDNEDRLDCFQRTGICHCGAALITEEQLLWRPDEL